MKIKTATTITLLACVLVLAPKAASAKTWRGIVPLHSTRADVERLLGPPTLEDSGYEIDDDRAFIVYASRGCREGLPGGWNLLQNTVVEIRVSSDREIILADVAGSMKTLEHIYGVNTSQIDYLNSEEGVRYTTVDGLVRAITYLGSAEDETQFACGGYKYAVPVPEGAKLIRFEQYPFDSYGKLPFEEAMARLDIFMTQLLESNKVKPNTRGFILVYAGQAAHLGEAKMVADCAKDYLTKVRHVDANSIV
ncbi:MAG: hypothetical protein ACMG6H_05720, partial [Acidobacteriota bacterium]